MRGSVTRSRLALTINLVSRASQVDSHRRVSRNDARNLVAVDHLTFDEDVLNPSLIPLSIR